METLYLKSASKAAMVTALTSAGFTFSDGQLVTATHMTETTGYFIHMLGVLKQETGITLTDSEGNEYPEMEDLPGYHANLRCNDTELIEGVSHLIVDVDSPMCIIA